MDKSNKESKTEILIARCTKQEKEQIIKKAKAEEKSESRYILDCCIAPTERKSDKLRKIFVQQIQMQEELNQLSYIVDDYEDKLPEDFTEDFRKLMKSIGEKMKCLH